MLVNAKCTNCGATLEVDSEKDAYICSHCGSAFIVEKAIQNYNNTYITNNNIKADVVNIYNTQESDFVIEKGVLIKYKGSDEKVIIPDKVKEIGFRAFQESKYLKEVTIPDSVEVIGTNSFSSCPNLQIINFGNGLKQIKDGAFWASKIEKLYLPRGNYTIEEKSFAYCEIKDLFIPKDVVFKHGVFIHAIIENIEFEDGIQSISEHLFWFCKSIPSINIPSSVKMIGDYAFVSTNLQSIVLQKPLTFVDNCAFCNSKLSEVVLKDLGEINRCSKIDKNNSNGVQFSKDAFKDCDFIKTVKLINTKTKNCIKCGLPIIFGRCLSCGIKYIKE